MSTSNNPQTCRCSLHAQIDARRHDRYRELAQAILGPAAPKDDFALAQALAEHAGLVKAGNVTPIRPRRHAA
jgi:hypothetical protein